MAMTLHPENAGEWAVHGFEGLMAIPRLEREELQLAVSGDEVMMYWDDDCACGLGGPRLDSNIRRFSEWESGDDKVTCAGSAQAYGEFIDYILAI